MKKTVTTLTIFILFHVGQSLVLDGVSISLARNSFEVSLGDGELYITGATDS